jgi:hypothetical protein
MARLPANELPTFRPSDCCRRNRILRAMQIRH